jgi:hypothetical protein
VSGSMERTKRRGERGLPCRRPRPCKMGFSAIPLWRTRDEDVVSKAVIQLRKRLGKPVFGAPVMNSHQMESKALLMLSLKRSTGVLLLWNLFARLKVEIIMTVFFYEATLRVGNEAIHGR